MLDIIYIIIIIVIKRYSDVIRIMLQLLLYNNNNILRRIKTTTHAILRRSRSTPSLSDTTTPATLPAENGCLRHGYLRIIILWRDLGVRTNILRYEPFITERGISCVRTRRLQGEKE